MLRPLLRSIRGWVVAVLAAAAVASTPAAAAAGCGDYVVIRDGTEATDHPAAPEPCHGPGCHGAPTRAPIAPVAPPTTGSPKDAVTLGTLDPPAADGSPFPPPTSDACPDGPAAGVFHPPRAG
ncbi:MAG: hypothetical protein U0804_00665 [Gemmataceae bacterium]